MLDFQKILDVPEILLLKGTRLSFDKLKEYGFVEKENYFIYAKRLDENLELQIKITKDGQVEDLVFDVETNDKYAPFYHSSTKSAYITKMRCEYDEIILDIIAQCCESTKDICSRTARKELLPGQLKTGDMILFSEQVEAMTAEYERLYKIEAENGVLSDVEQAKKENLESLLANPEIYAGEIPQDIIGYGTRFMASINGQIPRKFQLVYANLGVGYALDGTLFLNRDTSFGQAVFNQPVDAEINYENDKGVPFKGKIVQILPHASKTKNK